MVSLESMEYELKGTNLQVLVWRELQRVPAGVVITYSELASRVGYPRAIRAIASAVGRNPYPPIIPCHRVVRSDGSLGGYSGPGGVEQKRALLQSEGIMI